MRYRKKIKNQLTVDFYGTLLFTLVKLKAEGQLFPLHCPKVQQKLDIGKSEPKEKEMRYKAEF